MRAAWMLLSVCLLMATARAGSETPQTVAAAPLQTAAADANTPAAEFTADPNATVSVVETKNTSPEFGQDAAVERSRQLRREFFRVQLEPVKTMTSEEEQQKLDALIAQVSSLEPSKTRVVVAEPETAETSRSAATEEPLEVQGEPETVPAITAPSAADSDPNAAADKLLAELEKAEQVLAPMQLADVLYRQGHARAALKYYGQAAKALVDGDADNLQWVLFQMGNCCSESDPQKAIELYGDLLSRFPNSTWSAAARSRRTTLEWLTRQSVNELTSGGV